MSKKDPSALASQQLFGTFAEIAFLPPDVEVSRQRELKLRIHKAFRLFEREHSETADVREVGTILRALGINPTEAQLTSMIEALNVADLGFVRYPEFEDLALKILLTCHWKGALLVRHTEQEILRAFEVLDTEKVGLLDSEYLKELITTRGEKFSPSEVLELLNCAADPESGHIKPDSYAATLAYDG